ncbi:MAG: hypothetical protein ACMUIU_07130 [bacterium]
MQSPKCLTFKSPDDFFELKMIDYVERTWKQWLGPLVPDLPDFKRVIRDLRPQILFLYSTAA